MTSDLATHLQLIKLVIAYTLVGAFFFTVVVTCLSLIYKNIFVRPTQQSKLFTILIVELIVICVGSFANFLEFNPVSAQREIERPLREDISTANVSASQTKGKLQEQVLYGLKPQAEALATLLLKQAKEKGIELILISGYRSPEQQLELYAKKLSGVKLSTHNTGLAFDVAIVENGKLMFDDKKRYDEVGRIGKNLGLIWGGDSRVTPDSLHFETEEAKAALKQLGGT
jgi:hypothetical protein